MTLTTAASGFCPKRHCKPGADKTACNRECDYHGFGDPALRSEIRGRLLDYDGGGFPDPHIDDWIRLIDREREKAVNTAFKRFNIWTANTLDLCRCEHEDIDRVQDAIVADMFPPAS